MNQGRHVVVDPATEEVVCEIDLAGLDETDRAIDAAADRLRALAAGGAGRPRSSAAAFRGPGRRRRRGAGGPRGAQLRAHDQQRSLGGGQRPRRADVLLGCAGTPVRTADPGRRWVECHLQGAARRGRRHRAVELPDADRGLGLRAGAGGGQHRRAQAGRADPAHGDPAGRAGAGGGTAAGGLHRAGRAGLGGGPSLRHASPCAQGVLHRVRHRWARASWRAVPSR